MRRIFGIFVITLMLASLASAGVGIRWERESILINEGDNACLSYDVYNPWPDESYASIELSEELKGILTLQEVDTKLVPAETSSSNAIPIEFCFKAPIIYQRDCLIGNTLCKQDCNEPQKVYQGEVIIKEVPPPANIQGTGGSATAASVSAPLNVKINCTAHGRDFTIVYIIIGIIALLVILGIFLKKLKGSS